MGLRAIAFSCLVCLFVVLTAWRGISRFQSYAGRSNADPAKPERIAVEDEVHKSEILKSQITESSPQLYEPQPDDFRSAYQADGKNSAKQSWQVYYGWIVAFYHGNFLTEGWTAQGKRLISQFSDEQARARVTTNLNSLGRKIAQEWCKDRSAQRINNNDLTSFARQIDQAVQKSDSSGTALCATLEQIEQVVTSR